MDSSLHTTLAAWANFYLVTGSAAAALTGLQFVVQTLIASDGVRRVGGGDPEGTIAAFGSPTVVHFTFALTFSAILCVPWRHFATLRASLGILGGAAVIYSCVVLRRTLVQQVYKPVAEDWIFHIALPFVAYGLVIGAAVMLSAEDTTPLFALGAATLLLIYIGIHNAWDTVTFLSARAMRAVQSGDVPNAVEALRRPPKKKHGRHR